MVALGCQPAKRSSNQTETVIEAADWPYAPVSIRVHPLSRIKFGPDNGKPQVQALIEFLDRDGISTRGLGTLRIILAGASNSGSHAESRWECNLTDLDTNGQYYDEVTRTYMHNLSLDEADDVPLEPSLHAILVLPDGRVLADEKPIRISRIKRSSDDLDD